jgi:hypothetical protein
LSIWPSPTRNWKSSALEGLAVDLAFEVHGHAVAILGGGALRALGEGAALLAQDLDGLVDGGIRHLGRQLLHLGGGQVADRDFGEHLEHGIEGDLAFRGAVLLGDAGLAREKASPTLSLRTSYCTE